MNGDRVARAAAAGVVGGLIGLGIVASLLSVSRARSEARNRDIQAVVDASDRVSAELRGALAGLQGVDGIAADAEVTQVEFSAFTADVLSTSNYTALSFADIVTEEQRAGWQSSTGLQMRDSNGSGGFNRSSSRPTHVVVRLVHPQTSVARNVLGFDLLSDPVRAKAVSEALDVDRGVLVGPISLASTTRPGLFAMHAVRSPGGRVIGFVSSGMSLDSLISRLSGDRSHRAFTLKMDDSWLLGSGTEQRAVSTFQAGGRNFTIGVASPSAPNWTGPRLVVFASLLLFGLGYVSLRREALDRRRVRRRANRNERIALFAEGASALNSTNAVIAYATQHAGRALGADHTVIARADSSDRSMLVVSVVAGIENDRRTRTFTQPLNSTQPIAECARSRESVFVTGHDRSNGGSIDIFDRDTVVKDIMGSELFLPLALGSHDLHGVIGFAWNEVQPRSDGADVLGAGLLVAQVIGRSYERALAREIVQTRVKDLAEFTRALTTSRTSEEVHTAVGELLSRLFDARSVRLVDDRTHENAVANHRWYRLVEPESGWLVVEVTPNTIWSDAVETLALTIVDLVSAALARTRSFDEQRNVLQRLQYSLLSSPPKVSDYDIVVAYQSAVQAVGIGGDWYSVIDSDSHLFAVVGDVAGHGAEAVAVMAEVKTVVRYLLTKGTDLLHVVHEADGVLRRRNSFASFVAVSIDKRTGSVAYTSAGHPPPVIIAETSLTLTAPQGPWLGLPNSMYRIAHAVLEPGATLLLYTDGLIEQPGVVLDLSIAALLERARNFSTPNALIEGLLRARMNERGTDDDIAVLAIKRT